MLKQKRLLAFLLCVVLLLSVFMLVACNDTDSLEERIKQLQAELNGYRADYSPKSITVYVGEKKFELVTGKAFLHDVLKDLKADGRISAYEYGTDDINPFISVIDDLQQDFNSGKYYSVWHNVNNSQLWGAFNEYCPSRASEFNGDYATYAVTTYEGTRLFYSNVGVGILPLVDGCIYAIFVD